ncbi:MAG TPA: carboxypeptidase regulatory-like domain-containing protein [Bryobacteraceae bacterium]|nr:carboxypeptidase regulatory-like domain-containing protein [Bryobacteraceae bacterium]
MRLRNLLVTVAGLMLFAFTTFAQTGSMEGDIKGMDGKPLIGAMVKIDRTDIKGSYKVKTDKKGHYFHAGLPYGIYNVAVEVDGKDVPFAEHVTLRGGDPTNVSQDLSKLAANAPGQPAAAPGQEQPKGLTPAQKAEQEKQIKEREEAMKKNKELNDAFNAGIAAAQAKQYDQAVASFTKASELDAKQHVVWAQLAEAEVNFAETKKGAEADAEMQKGLDAYTKAIEIKADDAGYHNNYALALAKAKKYPEAQAELTKAATLDPPNAGRYYYNLGALLVNAGQNDPAGEAFKKAIDLDPNYADAQYQYGVTLLAKASIGADGKITPVPGTAEAFQKYLALKPDGPFADSAKSMLASLGTSVDTSYKNPAAKKGNKK